MAKVTIHKDAVETPSQVIIKAANATVTVTDAQGRQITIRKLLTLDRMDLFDAVGAESSENAQYMSMAYAVFSVSAIGDEPLPRLHDKRGIRALTQRLGDDGFAVVTKGIAENFFESSRSQEEARDAVKNG